MGVQKEFECVASVWERTGFNSRWQRRRTYTMERGTAQSIETWEGAGFPPGPRKEPDGASEARDQARARAEGDREGRVWGQEEATQPGHGRIYPTAREGYAAEAEAVVDEDTDLFVCEGCGAFVWGVVPGPLCSWCVTMRKFES